MLKKEMISQLGEQLAIKMETTIFKYFVQYSNSNNKANGDFKNNPNNTIYLNLIKDKTFKFCTILVESIETLQNKIEQINESFKVFHHVPQVLPQ